MSSAIPIIRCFIVLQLLLARSRVVSAANERIRGRNCAKAVASVGALLDLGSLMGKQQKIAMGIAVDEFNRLRSCSEKVELKVRDSRGDSAQAVAAAMDLAQSNQLLAIIGTITHKEARLASEISNITNTIPILSLTSPAATKELSPSPQLLNFIQLGNDINLHINCIAAIVGRFRWRKVTAIYELSGGFSSDPTVLIGLSDSLRFMGSEIENHLALPSFSSMSDPKSRIENELSKLKRKSIRVFLIVHSSLELATMLFEEAKTMGLMEKGSVWVVPDGVAGLLDSANSSVISNMQGVIGFTTSLDETSEVYRKFKSKFRRRFSSEYPEEESINNPSAFALHSYDAAWAIAQAARKPQGKFSMEDLRENVLSSKLDTQSGKTSYTIINVIGKGYREMAFWSPKLGFSNKNINVSHELLEINTGRNDSSGVLDTVYWPGGLQSVPKGWVLSSNEKKLKIGVPTNGAFSQFVNVSYDESMNETSVTGFSIRVFKEAAKRLPYHLEYGFVPLNGSYDEMVEQVSNETLDAAVGDISILAYRYHLVEFSQPYVESGLDMVVTEKRYKSNETWMFMDAFTKEMWLIMAAIHSFVGFVIWLIERKVNEELQGLGNMFWFLITVIFHMHKPITRPLARAVLTPWLFVILIVTSSFTASLTSMMTISQLEPSVLDIETLKKRNYSVGCDGNSFIVRYLVDVLKFKLENIRKIDSNADYPAAFNNKEIHAAFFVSPHAKVFLAKYSCQGFTKSGNTHRLGGFGFVFKKGSTLAGDISEALLSIIEGGEIEDLEKDMLSTTNCTPSESGNKAKQGSSLGYQPFLGLFWICAAIAALALLYIIICFGFNNSENLTRHIKGALALLRGKWRWAATNFVVIYSKVQSWRSMRLRRVGDVTEIRNAEGTIGHKCEKRPVAIEIV